MQSRVWENSLLLQLRNASCIGKSNVGNCRAGTSSIVFGAGTSSVVFGAGTSSIVFEAGTFSIVFEAGTSSIVKVDGVFSEVNVLPEGTFLNSN